MGGVLISSNLKEGKCFFFSSGLKWSVISQKPQGKGV